jgi:DNA-binding transcriptional LysR family regulator
LEAHLRAATQNLAVGIRQVAQSVSGLQTVSLGTYSWKVVARADSPFWFLPPEQQAVLRDQTVVTLQEDGPDPVRQLCKKNNMQIRGHVYGGYFMTAAAMVQAGGCLALMPEYLAPWLSPQLRMEEVFPEPLEVESVLLLNPKAADRLTTEFFEFIRTRYEP